MPPTQDTKKAKREAARQARIEAQRARERARKRKRIGLFAALTAVLLVAGVLIYQRAQRSEGIVADRFDKAGCAIKKYPEQDRDHIDANAARPKYNSTPPSSGPHRQQPANWGSYDEPVDDEVLVHNLEHGGIVIHHKGLSDTQTDRVSEIADDYPTGVIALPNENIKVPIALSAWRTVQTCDRVDEVVVRAFVEEYCNKGPEKFNLAC